MKEDPHETRRMEDDKCAIVSGEIETIEIKPESIELLCDTEDPNWSKEESSNDSNFQTINNNECCYVTASGEVIAVSPEEIVQTPFCLESYFMDSDSFKTRVPSSTSYQESKVIEIDRVTCYECDIEFCNEHRLLEHLMTHINVYKMGCNICDKDLNFEEKFQLHTMAVTWQSVYYCDFCRKSCAGVVRSKSHPPPPGKIYMCHDCEYFTQQENTKFECVRFYLNTSTSNYGCDPPKPPQPILPPPIPPPTPPPLPPQPPTVPPQQQLIAPAEVLKDHKQKPISESKLEVHNCYSSNSTSVEVKDCWVGGKSPRIKKENKNNRRPKPKVSHS